MPPLSLPWDPAVTRRALLLALAAWLSFAIATLLHVHNAYWAAMPVWVISQPARGVLLERAVFRVVGTLLGAAVGFAIILLPVPPLLQAVALALWIGLNAGTTHVLRGVHSYGALMAGMTSAVVVIPSLLAPAGFEAIAAARVQCTLVGVIVGSLVLALQTPPSPLAAFYAQIRAVSAEAVAYAARVLRGAPVEDGREERRILGHVSELEASARMHAAGSMAGYRRLGHVDLLVVGSLSTMAAAQAVRDGHSRFSPALPERLEAIAAHLGRDWHRPLPAEARQLPALDDSGLVRLDRALGEILAADQTLAVPTGLPPEPGTGWLAPHREWKLAWSSGLLATGASFAAAALALRLRVPAMGLAALGVCVFTMVLGGMALPQRVAPKLFAGVLLGVLVAVGYRVLVQPAITSHLGLLLSLVPFLLAGGFALAHPRSAPVGLDACMCFLMASQAGNPAVHDTARILRDSAALALSAGLMAALFILLPRRPQRQAVDAAAAIRRDLQRILEAGGDTGPALWRAQGTRQILRLSLHLGRARKLGRRWPRGLLATLNLGQAMIDLREAGMPEAVRVLLAAALRQRMRPGSAAEALRALAEAQAGTEPRRLLLGLADALAQSADLLAFGLPARNAGRTGSA